MALTDAKRRKLMKLIRWMRLLGLMGFTIGGVLIWVIMETGSLTSPGGLVCIAGSVVCFMLFMLGLALTWWNAD